MVLYGMITGMAASAYQKMYLILHIFNQAQDVLKFQISIAILDFINQVTLPQLHPLILHLLVLHLLVESLIVKNVLLNPPTSKMELAHSAGITTVIQNAIGVKMDILLIRKKCVNLALTVARAVLPLMFASVAKLENYSRLPPILLIQVYLRQSALIHVRQVWSLLCHPFIT